MIRDQRVPNEEVTTGHHPRHLVILRFRRNLFFLPRYVYSPFLRIGGLFAIGTSYTMHHL